MPLPFKAKLHISTVLLLDIDAESAVDALAKVRDYENKILSQEWCASSAPEGITRVSEFSYSSNKALADRREQDAITVLG